MDYPNIDSFRNAILDYLRLEKAYCEEDIKTNSSLPDDQKVMSGLLIEKGVVSCSQPPYYELSVSENNTKLRPGDKVSLISGKKNVDVRVVENTERLLTVQTNAILNDKEQYRIEVREFVLLDPLIKLAEQIEDGAPGSYWMKLLAGIEKPELVGYKPIDASSLGTVPSMLNNEQQLSCKSVFLRPSLYCLQGPPGTGKTDVLATMANTFSSAGYEVLIISNTHQAVNNALNKIKTVNSYLPVIKIGEDLKGEGLIEGIVRDFTYSEYLKKRRNKRKKEKKQDIVGMTMQAAVVNLGLRNTGFQPSIILVDEAGQMPLAQGSLIGAFGGGTIVLIGDDLQMPPIYHEKLVNNPLSVSLFTHLCRMCPECKGVLTTTYRMNRQITEVVNKMFYQTNGITLVASDYSADRTLQLEAHSDDSRINEILASITPIHQVDVSKDDRWTDDNHEEAQFIAKMVKAAIDAGLPSSEIAVITPYRRQVKAIRAYVREALGAAEDIPLIDTVERLQGQDVDLIIISQSVTNYDFYKYQESFIFNPNRLNVMLSRAKRKVVAIGKKPIIDEKILS